MSSRLSFTIGVVLDGFDVETLEATYGRWYVELVWGRRR